MRMLTRALPILARVLKTYRPDHEDSGTGVQMRAEAIGTTRESRLTGVRARRLRASHYARPASAVGPQRLAPFSDAEARTAAFLLLISSRYI